MTQLLYFLLQLVLIYFFRKLVTSDITVYIGLNDIDTDQVWKWEDGETANKADIIWAETEPNNAKGEENCATIKSEDDLKTFDAKCSLWRKALCEIPSC